MNILACLLLVLTFEFACRSVIWPFFHFLYAALSLLMIQPPLFKSVLEPVLDNLGELSVSRSTDRLTWGIPVSDAIHRVHYTGILSTVSDSQRCHSFLCFTIIQPQMGKFVFISFLLLKFNSPSIWVLFQILSSYRDVLLFDKQFVKSISKINSLPFNTIIIMFTIDLSAPWHKGHNSSLWSTHLSIAKT